MNIRDRWDQTDFHSHIEVYRKEAALVRNLLSLCSMYLDYEFVVTKQPGGVQLSLQLSREY